MLELYGHPFSSYTWKAEIALYEKELDFTLRVIEPDQPEHVETLRGHWPLGKFPMLLDDGRPVIESSIIIEYLDRRFPEARPMLPRDADAAFAVRFMDRVFDNHVMGQVQAVVYEYLIDAANPDQDRITRARAALDLIYAWLDPRLDGADWAVGDRFTLADCAAAPSLFYADWVRPIPPELRNLKHYRANLLARPSVARCVEAARPYRELFPLGAPDWD